MKRLMSCWYILLIYLCTKIFRKNWKAASWIFHERSLTQMPRLFFLFQKAEALLCQNLLYYSFIWKRKNAKKFCLLFLCFHLRRLLLLIYQRKYWMCVCLCVLAYVIEWLAVFSAYKILRPFLNACDSYTFTKSRL